MDNLFVQGAITSALLAQAVEGLQRKTGLGAHSIFLGQVRADETPAGPVTAIHYTAYEDMAREKAAEICAAVVEEYQLELLEIYHSLGTVKTGEISLLVLACSRHRRPAIEACAAAVERLKKELPVWGQELTEQDVSFWKVNT